jgi:hypothetical protein
MNKTLNENVLGDHKFLESFRVKHKMGNIYILEANWDS